MRAGGGSRRASLPVSTKENPLAHAGGFCFFFREGGSNRTGPRKGKLGLSGKERADRVRAGGGSRRASLPVSTKGNPLAVRVGFAFSSGREARTGRFPVRGSSAFRGKSAQTACVPEAAADGRAPRLDCTKSFKICQCFIKSLWRLGKTLLLCIAKAFLLRF